MSQSKRLLAAAVAVAASLALPALATAHNAGHLFLPDGTCQEVGSFREAPLVGQDQTQLDLVPQTPLPRDEYGVSFVGFHGNTPIHPGACPVTPLSAQNVPAPVNVLDVLLANQPFNGE